MLSPLSILHSLALVPLSHAKNSLQNEEKPSNPRHNNSEVFPSHMAPVQRRSPLKKVDLLYMCTQPPSIPQASKCCSSGGLLTWESFSETVHSLSYICAHTRLPLLKHLHVAVAVTNLLEGRLPFLHISCVH